MRFDPGRERGAPEPHEDAENDSPERGEAEGVGADDGSNVVTVDFGRKK